MGKSFIEYDDGPPPAVPFDPDRSFRDAVNVAIVEAQLQGHLTVDGLRYLKDLVWSFPGPPTLDPPAAPDADEITWHPSADPLPAELRARIVEALKSNPHHLVLVARADLQELLNRCDDVPPNGDKGQTK